MANQAEAQPQEVKTCSLCRTPMKCHRSEAMDAEGQFIDVFMCPECDLISHHDKQKRKA